MEPMISQKLLLSLKNGKQTCFSLKVGAWFNGVCSGRPVCMLWVVWQPVRGVQR